MRTVHDISANSPQWLIFGTIGAPTVLIALRPQQDDVHPASSISDAMTDSRSSRVACAAAYKTTSRCYRRSARPPRRLPLQRMRFYSPIIINQARLHPPSAALFLVPLKRDGTMEALRCRHQRPTGPGEPACCPAFGLPVARPRRVARAPSRRLGSYAAKGLSSRTARDGCAIYEQHHCIRSDCQPEQG